MHPSQMFVPEVKSLYNGILADSLSSINLKIQVLKNLQTYLQEEDTRMQEADRECKQSVVQQLFVSVHAPLQSRAAFLCYYQDIKPIWYCSAELFG